MDEVVADAVVVVVVNVAEGVVKDISFCFSF